MIPVEEIKAEIVIRAYAACNTTNGCELCPLYKEELKRTKQRELCKESIGAKQVREALITLRGKNE